MANEAPTPDAHPRTAAAKVPASAARNALQVQSLSNRLLQAPAAGLPPGAAANLAALLPQGGGSDLSPSLLMHDSPAGTGDAVENLQHVQ